MPTSTLVFDNGAHTIKAGFSILGTEPDVKDCQIIPNCIARSQRDKITYIAADLDSCADFGELQVRRPVERGYIANWETEKAIWDRTILDKRSPLHCDPHDYNLFLTEAPNAPGALQKNADEMVFEEYEFASLYRTVVPTFNAYAPSPFATTPLDYGVPPECLLVVDIGHSHTTVTPLYQGRPLHPACRRLEIGGRLLTNHLKELLSRTMDMQREEWITQEIKEDTCFVAADSTAFGDMLERAWKGGQKDPRHVDNSLIVDYVLPDYDQLKRGYTRSHDASKGARMRRLGMEGGNEMVLPVGNERFTAPEVLFTPSDIGMQQEGLAGTIMQSIHALPKGLWQPMLASILVVGGTAKLSGLMERLEGDLRKRLDESYLVRVKVAENPIKNAWLGGARLAQNEELLKSVVVTRAEYLEHGELWTRRRFAGMIHR